MMVLPLTSTPGCQTAGLFKGSSRRVLGMGELIRSVHIAALL
jgi:hypothetical protein